jgi:hypothetical protein
MQDEAKKEPQQPTEADMLRRMLNTPPKPKKAKEKVGNTGK